MNQPAVTTNGRRGILAWAAYDWANSAYAVVIMTVFAPLVFKDYWAAGFRRNAVLTIDLILTSNTMT